MAINAPAAPSPTVALVAKGLCASGRTDGWEGGRAGRRGAPARPAGGKVDSLTHGGAVKDPRRPVLILATPTPRPSPSSVLFFSLLLPLLPCG